MTSSVPLTTRETVKRALEVAETSRLNWQIDDALHAATEIVEGFLKRTFRPVTKTLALPWPSPVNPHEPWRIWLDANELISLTTLTVGSETLTASYYKLSPADGPPYACIEANLYTQGTFDYGSNWQANATITGLFGYTDDEKAATTLAEALDATETGVDLTTAANVGIGDVLRVDSERMVVTDRGWLTTGTTITSDVAAAQGTRTIPVSDGTQFTAGEHIQIGSETLWVQSITGNNLTARRAWDGSTLEAHSSGATVYASRTMTVERGALGTTAATHSSGATVYRHVPPHLVSRLALAETLIMLDAERVAWASAAGANTSAMKRDSNSIGALREATRAKYGRKARFR